MSFLLNNYILFLSMILSSCILNSNDKNNDYLNINAFDQNNKLARTINLGNALEAPDEGDWGVVLKEEYFKIIKEAGFSAVRIPVRWSNHILNHESFTINPDFMNRVRWAVSNAIKNNLMVIVNIHHFEDIMESPTDETQKLFMIWKQIAQTFDDDPQNIIYELLNEPTGNLTVDIWNSIFPSLIDTIRIYSPDNTIMIGGGNWNSINGLMELVLPNDIKNIIGTFHYYAPFEFTHQGAEWVNNSNRWLGTTWQASISQMNALEKDLLQAQSWCNEYNIPIFLGEFGAYSKADINSRILWTNAVARTAENYNISWGYWEFCSGFGVYDNSNNKWNDDLLNALIPQ